MTRFTDGEGNTTIYRYQEWGLQASVEEPATTAHPNLADRLWVIVYDPGGLPIEERQPGGVTITRSFDELGRLIEESGSGTGVISATRSLGYDLAGRMVTASHPDGTLGFVWDDRGLLVEVTGPAGSATYTYDPVGRMTERVDAAGTATFTWTPRSELESLHDPVTGTIISYDWDEASQLVEVVYGTGSAPTRTLVWDDLGRLVSDTLTDTTPTTVASFAYGYDDDGNVVTVEVDLGGNPLDGTHSYGYDHAGRLVSWTDPDQTTVTYGWDAASNRTGAGADSFTYDQRNRLVASPDGTHTHEARGTLASVGTTTYDFDALGRLTDADGIAYTYDSLDRIAVRDSIAFTYNSPGRHPVSDGGHLWSRSPGGRLVAQDDGTNQRLAGLNRHGDLTYLFTTAGAATDTVVYDPFGDPAATTGTGGSTLGFQGDYTDPHSAQVWMGARWYAPAHAVFTSRDTLQGELTTPVTLNRYTYAAANPLLYWDPDGRQAALIDDPIGRLTTNRTTRSRDAAADRLSGLASRYLASNNLSTTATDGAAQAVGVAEVRRNPVVYMGGTLEDRENDDARARTFSEILGRSVRALEPGAHRPRRAVNRRDAFGFFDRSEPSAHERLSRCHGGFYGIPFIFPDCHGPDHDSDFYAEQLQAMIAASPTDKIDVIAHSYSAQELSIVLERYPELKDSIDNFLLLGPTKVRVQAFEGVNVHVVHHAGDPIPSVPHGRGRLGHAADIPGATVRTTTINVDHALGVHDPEGFLGTVNNRHDGWFMGGDVGRSMRRELDRTVRELGWK